MDGRPLSPEQKLGQDLAFQVIDSATKQILSDEEKAGLKALFELVDADANGKVTRSELLKVRSWSALLPPWDLCVGSLLRSCAKLNTSFRRLNCGTGDD